MIVFCFSVIWAATIQTRDQMTRNTNPTLRQARPVIWNKKYFEPISCKLWLENIKENFLMFLIDSLWWKKVLFTCLAYCRVGQVTILPFLKIIHFLVYWMVTLVSGPTRVQHISYCVLIGPFVYKKWRNFRVGKIFTQPIVKLMKVWNRRKHFFLVHSSMWTIHI